MMLAEIKAIVEALKDNTSLLNIDLGENQIGGAATAVLAKILNTNRSLQ